MDCLIGCISIVAFLGCLAGIIFNFILKGEKRIRKRFSIGMGVSFVAFMIAVSVPTNTQSTTPKVQENKVASTTDNKANESAKKEENKPIPAKATTTTTDTNLGQLKVHYINVGQGDSILVEQDKHFMLIDAGTNHCEGLVVDYLKKQGVTKLDYAIGTHPHEDHIGGMDKVIDNFDIGTLLMPKKIANTKTFKDVLLSAKNKGLKITQPVIGTNYTLGKATFTILAPKDHDYESTNNYSIVQKLKFGNTSFIFTGDAEAISEMEMVNANLDLQADVLKVGHHGSKTSTCQAFLDKVNPKYAVISCGKDNKYHHPNQSTMDRLKAKNVKVYRTDESGNVVATSNGKDITFNCNEGSYNFRDSGNNSSSGVAPIAKPSGNTGVVNNKSVGTSHSNGTYRNNTNISEKGKVYYTSNGKCYHSSTGCPALKRSKNITTGTVKSCGGRKPCSKCN